MKNDFRIVILVTGGTFDKEFNEINGELYLKKHICMNFLNWGVVSLILKLKP